MTFWHFPHTTITTTLPCTKSHLMCHMKKFRMQKTLGEAWLGWGGWCDLMEKRSIWNSLIWECAGKHGGKKLVCRGWQNDHRENVGGSSRELHSFYRQICVGWWLPVLLHLYILVCNPPVFFWCGVLKINLHFHAFGYDEVLWKLEATGIRSACFQWVNLWQIITSDSYKTEVKNPFTSLFVDELNWNKLRNKLPSLTVCSLCNYLHHSFQRATCTLSYSIWLSAAFVYPTIILLQHSCSC